jgi:hypothetical protein
MPGLHVFIALVYIKPVRSWKPRCEESDDMDEMKDEQVSQHEQQQDSESDTEHKFMEWEES